MGYLKNFRSRHNLTKRKKDSLIYELLKIKSKPLSAWRAKHMIFLLPLIRLFPLRPHTVVFTFFLWSKSSHFLPAICDLSLPLQFISAAHLLRVQIVSLSHLFPYFLVFYTYVILECPQQNSISLSRLVSNTCIFKQHKHLKLKGKKTDFFTKGSAFKKKKSQKHASMIYKLSGIRELQA